MTANKNPQLDYHYLVKLAILGDPQVGKTTFMKTYLESPNHTTPPNNARDFIVGSTTIQDARIKFQIFDYTTSGSNLKVPRPSVGWFGTPNGLLLLFDVYNLATFQNLSSWAGWFETYCSVEKPPVIFLIANDCGSRGTTPRQVSEEDGQAFAQECGWSYFETTPLDDSEGIYSTVTEMIRQVMDKADIIGPRLADQHVEVDVEMKGHDQNAESWKCVLM